ncbi:MAG: hypothetical protein E6J80_00850 [Deltaproteobacteria bacterium]|nr:MAG: hypothetical protein E6J80_00850 [Deltaproteobacteria bacterium]
MTTIVLPPEIEEPLAEEARKQGTTPELLAVDCLRKLFTPAPTIGKPADGETLFDFLSDYVGTVKGTTEALSENCGQRFTQGLIEKQQRGRV